MAHSKDHDSSTTLPLSEEELSSLKSLKGVHGTKPLLCVLYHRDGVRAVPLIEGQRVVIGRAYPADVAIDDKSLSRQHASIELTGGTVWVEDLDSTNGTRVSGEEVARGVVDEGDELAFGAVVAAIVTSGAVEGDYGLESHDRFCKEIAAECVRARTFGRRLALLYVSGDRRQPSSHVSSWFSKVVEQLMPFDRVGLYSQNTLEILLAERDLKTVVKAAKAIVGGHRGLRCGAALVPDNAHMPDELAEVALEALHCTSHGEPVQIATTRSTEAVALSTDENVRSNLVMATEAMQDVYRDAMRVAASALPVLITGETGVGKEVIARAIHEKSKRKDHPMVCVNCGALPSHLVESTLFGHERGAFTGASKTAPGIFESAGGGTVLLDEIGELPAAAQAALLRVLETKRFNRVGSTKDIKVDVRVLAATHRDLETMCEAGGFRSDLLYRLNTMVLEIPPLRERLEEIKPLAQQFMERANQANDCRVSGMDDEVSRLMLAHHWPGNIRELKNAIERAVVIAQGDVISIDDMPRSLRDLAASHQRADLSQGAGSALALAEGEEEINLRAQVEQYETKLIVEFLEKTGWDRKIAARRLGLPLRTLYHKMKALGIVSR